MIFGEAAAETVRAKHTVLELDTVRFKTTGATHPLYAVIEVIPMEEADEYLLNTLKHAEMVASYRNRDWETSLNAARQLIGKWDGEVDPFYEEIKARSELFAISGVPDDWDYVIEK